MPGTDVTPPNAEPKPRRCHCVIAHPQDENERARAQAALDNALATNDAQGALLACMQLMQPCQTRDEQAAR
ncbi:hypothetical protein ACKI1J_40670 [Streptomyces scabiei]|uniref:hypothetical protein n=1 Tax=Streptomyces scabiei TaxID=1930 RepID=UPI0038F772BD